MRSVQAMLFDMDGTLVDSVPAHIKAWTRALRACGANLPPEAIHPEIGKGADHLIEDLVGPVQAHRCADTAQRLHSLIFTREFLPRLRVFPSVNGLFADLRRRDCRIAIVSSAKRAHLDRLIKQIAAPIDLVVSGDDVRATKPDPALWQVALDRLAIQADQAIMVGDSPHDFTAAAPLGLIGVGVLTGGFRDETLVRAGARRIYADLDELRRHLGDWLPIPMTA